MYRHRLESQSAMGRGYVKEYQVVATSDADFQPGPHFLKKKILKCNFALYILSGSMHFPFLFFSFFSMESLVCIENFSNFKFFMRGIIKILSTKIVQQK